jgi:serine/threonine-protein kinase
MVSTVLQGDRDPSLDQDRHWLTRVTNGRYEVVREIAQGGMSRVLLGLDLMLGRPVALKVLSSASSSTVEGRERFRREALITAKADHPHIVPCYDFICDGARAVAVMRYVPGDSLEHRLTGTPLDPDMLLGILVPIADALAHMHQRGIIHRDVKPANILLRSGDDWPFLIDFGVATLRTSDYSRFEATQRLGTPDFMSPEQALGAWDADHRSDIYSLGLVMYAGLAGSLPFRGSPLALAAQRTAFDVPPLRQSAPSVPKALAEIVDRCLAREPSRRWRDAATLGRALSRAA